MIIYQFFLQLLALVPACTAVLALTLCPWRTRLNLKAALNLKRPVWLFYFSSLTLALLAYAGGLLIPPLFRQSDPKGFYCLPFLAMVFFGMVCCFVAAVRIWWLLISAILSHARRDQAQHDQGHHVGRA